MLKLTSEEAKGMNPKKIIEVETCAPLIHSFCEEIDVKLIIDIGAGFGYLSKTLARYYGYDVIGLENREAIVKSSEKKLPKGSFHSVCLNITEDTCIDDIENVYFYLEYR